MICMGSTKQGEYYRTIEMLMEKTGKTKEDVMYILYFLYDSQYSNRELKEMADLIKGELYPVAKIKEEL